ncbi:hypothetical protein [Nocardia sp. NPDC004604]|uniref:hypothetical protein n=1 Tax=Nocardia sp. NPDC004604 TaxID=3157013 RepID=UPI0033A585A3
MERIGSRFARSEPRSRVRDYVSGLVADLERKNGWTLAGIVDPQCPHSHCYRGAVRHEGMRL